jgi:hypothetical protein
MKRGMPKMMGNEERIRQTARQGKSERMKALKRIVMMVKTEAVRIANKNPKAGPIAKHNRKQKGLVRENCWLPRPPKDPRSLIRAGKAKQPSQQRSLITSGKAKKSSKQRPGKESEKKSRRKNQRKGRNIQR